MHTYDVGMYICVCVFMPVYLVVAVRARVCVYFEKVHDCLNYFKIDRS